jgi:hypothetical protein
MGMTAVKHADDVLITDPILQDGVDPFPGNFREEGPSIGVEYVVHVPVADSDDKAALNSNRCMIGDATPPDARFTEPIAVRLNEATRLSGLSRSELYRRAGRSEIILLKSGRTTLVQFRSLRRLITSLPRASIRPAP